MTTAPVLPPRLEGLRALAYNLWWSWQPDAIRVFERLDAIAWESDPNPVRLLQRLDRSRLEAFGRDDAYVGAVRAVLDKLETYVRAPLRNDRTESTASVRVAYFCAEYAIARALPFYSGGLGVLAGDHLKSASDLGIPLVAVGIAYREGYYRQQIGPDGRQRETFPRHDFSELPMTPVRDAQGRHVTVGFEFADRPVRARVWRVLVGRVPLYLLDSDLGENDPRDRTITARLYGGDADLRVRQEIVLAILGLRALRAVGESPNVFHMNEGHAAFLAFERAREVRAHDRQRSWAEALAHARRSMLFTTHTPVPAGNDVFDAAQVEWYLRAFRDGVDVPMRDLLEAARPPEPEGAARFSMPVLALRTSARANGVSALHAAVARRMWHPLWPERAVDEVPIGAITNGVHPPTWLAAELRSQLETEGGIEFSRAGAIADETLWRMHERARSRLLEAVRIRVGSPSQALRDDALTLGFARRFATYKRASLLLRDPERLARLLTRDERPVQLVIAGKPHPSDGPAKEVLHEIVRATTDPRYGGRIVFVPDYDVVLARALVQGCDVWINLPRPPMEASGTSGMKAAMNGVLNASVLDGWWCEGFSPDVGWAIGTGGADGDPETQDENDARSLLDTIENEIVLAFFERGTSGVPGGWCRRMRASIATLGPRFSSDRMVTEYFERQYLPLATDST